MVQLRTEIEIAATPEEVRAIVLDFARYPEWHKSFITHISATPPTTDTYKLPQGETLDVTVSGLSFVPIITSNTATEFSWHGSVLGGAFAGKHIFQFLPSHVTPNGTTFVHGEDYDGWLTWMFREGMIGIGRKNALNIFNEFTKDVKKRADALKQLKEGIAKTQDDPMAKL